MIQSTINIDVEIVYHWYDHLLLRDNGDADIITTAIKNGDYDTFIQYYNLYNNKYFNGDESIIFFPAYPSIFYNGEIIGTIDITKPLGFSMITNSEYECS